MPMNWRSCVRLYRRPDGGVSIMTPAWNDWFSPFSAEAKSTGAQFRRAYESIPSLPSHKEQRLALRVSAADWMARFPFDPFTVSEAEFYEWAVTSRFSDYVHIGDCDRAELPPSREFRDCWRHDGTTIHVDPVLETEERWRRVRRERDQRLQASDGLMARAQETGVQERQWKAYRQALRDLPASATDPKTIIWPAPPEG